MIGLIQKAHGHQATLHFNLEEEKMSVGFVYPDRTVITVLVPNLVIVGRAWDEPVWCKIGMIVSVISAALRWRNPFEIMFFQKSLLPFRTGADLKIISVLVSEMTRSPVFGMDNLDSDWRFFLKGPVPILRIIFPGACVHQTVHLEGEKRREPSTSYG